MKHEEVEELERKLRKPRNKRPRVKVSGKSVLKLKELIARKRKK